MAQRLAMIIMILIILFGGGYYAYQRLLPPPETAGEIQYATKPVVRGDLSVGVDASGPLHPSRGGGIQVPGGHSPTGGASSYAIEEVLVTEGDSVTQGQLLVRLSAREIESQIQAMEAQLKAERDSLAAMLGVSPTDLDRVDPSHGITLRAPISGRIVGLSVKEGEELKQGQIVARVVDDSRFTLVAKLTPAEFPWANENDPILLRFSQFDGWVDGRIISINPEPIPESSQDLLDSLPGGSRTGDDYQFVYWVTIEGTNAGLIRPGMLARVGFFTGASPSQGAQPDPSDVSLARYYAKVDGYADEQRILSGADAIATRVFVHEMQPVKAGDRLVSLSGEDARRMISEAFDKLRGKQLEVEQLRTQLTQLDVRASMDGTVAHIDAQVGQTVQSGQWLGHLYNTADMQMWTQVDDIDVLLVKTGAPVHVTVAALPDDVLDGEVMDVSTMGKDEMGVSRFQVSIRVQGIPGLRPGMQAEARIEAGSVENVLLVPLEAIFEEDGQTLVEVLDPDGTVRIVQVRLGLMDRRYAEVKEGLEEGQQVVTGSTADLLPSLKIRSQDTLLPTRGDGKAPADPTNRE